MVSPKGTILIVDQDSELASLLGSYLTAQGFRVQFTTRVREALRKLNNQKFLHIFLEPALSPDNSWEILQELISNKLNETTPVTLMTQALETSLPMGHVKRLHSILEKPFNLQEFSYQIASAEAKSETPAKAA